MGLPHQVSLLYLLTAVNSRCLDQVLLTVEVQLHWPCCCTCSQLCTAGNYQVGHEAQVSST